jgi:hypothetical protein
MYILNIFNWKFDFVTDIFCLFITFHICSLNKNKHHKIKTKHVLHNAENMDTV